MEYTSYRDGGTKSFKVTWFSWYFKEGVKEVCQDGRVGSKTKGDWFLGYPDKGRKLTDIEKEYIVPEIIKAVEADVKWRVYYLDNIK